MIYQGGNECAHFDINLVSTQDNRNSLTDTLEITMPVRNVLVRDLGRHVEHDDPTLTLNVVTIPKTTKLFLPCCVPHVEADHTCTNDRESHEARKASQLRDWHSFFVKVAYRGWCETSEGGLRHREWRCICEVGNNKSLLGITHK